MGQARKKHRFEDFAAGIVHICRPGEATPYQHFRFGEETVSLVRYYGALSEDIHIARCIHILLQSDIEPGGQAIIENEAYEIKQVKHRRGTYPPTTMLALSEVSDVTL